MCGVSGVCFVCVVMCVLFVCVVCVVHVVCHGGGFPQQPGQHACSEPTPLRTAQAWAQVRCRLSADWLVKAGTLAQATGVLP